MNLWPVAPRTAIQDSNESKYTSANTRTNYISVSMVGVYKSYPSIARWGPPVPAALDENIKSQQVLRTTEGERRAKTSFPTAW